MGAQLKTTKQREHVVKDSTFVVSAKIAQSPVWEIENSIEEKSSSEPIIDMLAGRSAKMSFINWAIFKSHRII